MLSGDRRNLNGMAEHLYPSDRLRVAQRAAAAAERGLGAVVRAGGPGEARAELGRAQETAGQGLERGSLVEVRGPGGESALVRRPAQRRLVEPRHLRRVVGRVEGQRAVGVGL